MRVKWFVQMSQCFSYSAYRRITCNKDFRLIITANKEWLRGVNEARKLVKKRQYFGNLRIPRPIFHLPYFF